jgi:Lar family restriction alleviation protein
MAKRAITPLPCPFCGGELRLKGGAVLPCDVIHSSQGSAAQCQTCGAVGPEWLLDKDRGAKTAEVIKAWNQRPEANRE